MASCLTAIDLEGKVLWQVGKPNRRNVWEGGDTAVQVHDIDGDGQLEVIYQDPKSLLTILDGKTGKQKRQVQLAGGFDCLLFADFTGSGRAQQLVVKDRYSSFWVYDAAQDFKLLWSKTRVIPGHYGINYDFNGDGKDELLMGYTLYAGDGTVLWSHQDDFPGGRNHDDAVDVKDMDGDGRPEIAIATSEDAILVAADGKTYVFVARQGKMARVEVEVGDRLTESAACLVRSDQDLGVQMRKLMEAAGQKLPATRPALEINPAHALIQLLGRTPDGERFRDLALTLYDEAQLAEGTMPSDAAEFSRRLNRLLLAP